VKEMNEKELQSVKLRKFQEMSANMRTGGFHHEIAKWHKAIYDAYVKTGFTPEQALVLTKAHIKSGG